MVGSSRWQKTMTHATNPDRDRRVRQADRLARILSVLRLIQSRGRWNAKSIAKELESSSPVASLLPPGNFGIARSVT